MHSSWVHGVVIERQGRVSGEPCYFVTSETFIAQEVISVSSKIVGKLFFESLVVDHKPFIQVYNFDQF